MYSALQLCLDAQTYLFTLFYLNEIHTSLPSQADIETVFISVLATEVNSSSVSSIMTSELVRVGSELVRVGHKGTSNCTQVRKMVATIVNSVLSNERGNLAILMKQDIDTQKKIYNMSQKDCNAARMSKIIAKMVAQ